MIAVPVGPDLRAIVVGAPSYFSRHARPNSPADTMEHACINKWLHSPGSFYAWEFEKGGRPMKVRVKGPLTFNNGALRVKAALAGLGLANLMEDRVQVYLSEGTLVEVLSDWSPSFSGYHLYYPKHRQISPAFAVLVEELRRHS
ncbi:MAG: LysR substrate-binding domain-containing protein [Janthinobacterium lividum]